MANSKLDQLASDAAADIAATDTFIKKWWGIAMGYIPETWQRVLAAAVVLLVVWNWGYAAASSAWSYVPERQTMIGVLPATNNALAEQDQKLATSRSTLSQKIDALAVSLTNLQRSVAAIVNQGVAVENRVDALETKVAPPLTTGAIDPKHAKRRKKTSE